MACPSPKLLLLDSARWARARAVVRPKRRVGVQSRARGFSPAPRLRQARRRPALAGRAGHAFGAGNARGPGAVGEAPRACLTAATARATGTACAARATDTVSAADSCGTAEEPSGPTRTAGNTASATVTAVCAVAPVAARPAGPADGVLIAKSTGVATGAAVAAVTASPADSTGPTDSAAATVAAVADQHAAGATLATHATGSAHPADTKRAAAGATITTYATDRPDTSDRVFVKRRGATTAAVTANPTGNAGAAIPAAPALPPLPPLPNNTRRMPASGPTPTPQYYQGGGWGAPPSGGPSPWAQTPRKTNPWPLVAGAAAVVLVLVLGAIGIWIAIRPKPVQPPQPVAEERLSALLLNSSEVNAVMGSSSMQPGKPITSMDSSPVTVSLPDCQGALYTSQDPVYAGTGYTAINGLISSEPGDNYEHWVNQAVVAFPTADKARAFVQTSADKWKNCAGKTVTVTNKAKTYRWTFADVKGSPPTITVIDTQEGAEGWECQRAMSVANNVVVDVNACGYQITNQAGQIAAKIVDKVNKE